MAKKKFYCVMYKDESNVFKKKSEVNSFIRENPTFDGVTKEFDSLEVAELWGELQEEKAMRVDPGPPKQFNGPEISKGFKEISELYQESKNLASKKMRLCYEKLAGHFF